MFLCFVISGNITVMQIYNFFRVKGTPDSHVQLQNSGIPWSHGKKSVLQDGKWYSGT